MSVQVRLGSRTVHCSSCEVKTLTLNMTEEKPQQFDAPPPGYDGTSQPQQSYPLEKYPPGGQEKPGYPDQLQGGYPPQPYPSQQYPPQGSNPPGYHQPSYPPQNYPPQGYTQQVSQNNVVVVSQPGATPPATVHVQQPSRANDFMVCTIVLMVLCCFHGNILSVLLLIPALICSVVAHNSNSSGQQDTAKTCGCLALSCNITVVVIYALEVITAIALIIVAVTSGFAVASSFGGCVTQYTCGYFGFGGSYTCTYRCTY